MLYAAGHMAHLVGRCSQPRLHQSLTEAKHAWEACQHPHQQCLAEQCIEALMYAPHPCAPPSLAGCCCATAFITRCAAAAAAWLIAGRSCPLGWLTPAQQYCSAAHMAVLVLELNRSCMCVMTQQGRTLPTPSREFGVCLFEGVDTTASGVSAASLCTL